MSGADQTGANACHVQEVVGCDWIEDVCDNVIKTFHAHLTKTVAQESSQLTLKTTTTKHNHHEYDMIRLNASRQVYV